VGTAGTLEGASVGALVGALVGSFENMFGFRFGRSSALTWGETGNIFGASGFALALAAAAVAWMLGFSFGSIAGFSFGSITGGARGARVFFGMREGFIIFGFGLGFMNGTEGADFASGFGVANTFALGIFMDASSSCFFFSAVAAAALRFFIKSAFGVGFFFFFFFFFFFGSRSDSISVSASVSVSASESERFISFSVVLTLWRARKLGIGATTAELEERFSSAGVWNEWPPRIQ